MGKKVLRKIKTRIRSFDLFALVKLLQSLGYRSKEIYFESHISHTSARSLCEKITFSDKIPRVRIALNMGLLSENTPLPSFFIKYLESEEIDGEKFIRFLSFFNHHLIQEFLKMTVPEKNETLFPNWMETHHHYLSLLGFESISTLWLIFKGCFSELVVSIKKNARMMRLHSSSLILGRDGHGGSSYIGERLEQTLSSFKITFTTEEEVSELGTPWPIEINRRLLDWIFPIVEKTDLHLSIILVIKHKYGHLHLSKSHYLGFDRIGKSCRPFQLLLFHGFIKNLQRNNFLAET